VRDWDLTTDAPWRQVAPLVADLEYELIEPNGIFTTAYLCRIQVLGASIDLMGGFSIEGTAIPTRVTGQWKGIALGCPNAWARAYRLMGRHEKAALLEKLPALES
jgi:hypothetical protein